MKRCCPHGRERKTTDDEEIWFEEVNNGECNKNTRINRTAAFANKGLNYTPIIVCVHICSPSDDVTVHSVLPVGEG